MNDFDSPTMFAHIVARLTNRTEDVAVEALGFILSRSDAARRALRDLLKLEGLDVGEMTDAGTQVGDETLARPDLAIYDRERKERVHCHADRCRKSALRKAPPTWSAVGRDDESGAGQPGRRFGEAHQGLRRTPPLPSLRE